RSLHVGLELFGLLQQLGLLVTGCLGDELAERLLLGAQLVEADAGRPAPFVGRQEGVDERDVLSTGALGSTHTVGVLTEQAKVNQIVKATGAGWPSTTGYRRGNDHFPLWGECALCSTGSIAGAPPLERVTSRVR